MILIKMLFPKKREVMALANKRGGPIEFLGASGVGKTHLYNYFFSKVNAESFIIKQSPLNADYQRLEHYLNLVSNKSRRKIRKHLGLDSSFLTEDAYLLSVHEGIFQYYTQPLLALLDAGDPFVLKLAKNRKFVFCHAPKEIVVDRIFKRLSDSGKIHPSHKGADFESLSKIVQFKMEVMGQLASRLQLIADIVCIDTSLNDDFNFSDLFDFYSDNAVIDHVSLV